MEIVRMKYSLQPHERTDDDNIIFLRNSQQIIKTQFFQISSNNVANKHDRYSRSISN